MKKIVIGFKVICLLLLTCVFFYRGMVCVSANSENLMSNITISWQGLPYTGVYEGDMENGIPTGLGKFEGNSIDENESGNVITYEGKWKNGKFHGKGRLEDSLKGLIYEGKFKKGMLNGSIKISSNKDGQKYTLMNFKNDVPCNVSWKCDAEGNYLDYDCYYRGISIKEIQYESKEMDYGEIIYNAKDYLYQKVKLQCKVESQEDAIVESQEDAVGTLNRYVIVSDKKGNKYLLQYDLSFGPIATNYMPFFENGQELMVYGYYIGLQGSASKRSKSYPCVQAVFAEKEDGNNYDIDNLDFQYDSFLNYPYQYENRNISLEGTIEGIYKQTDKEIDFLVKSGSYSQKEDDLYICCVQKEVLTPDMIPSEGEIVVFEGNMNLLLLYGEDDKLELSTFIPIVDSAKIVE